MSYFKALFKYYLYLLSFLRLDYFIYNFFTFLPNQHRAAVEDGDY